MSDNIVSAVSRFLTPELVGKMASASGLDRGTTQSAVTAFVPAILNGLSDLASKPGGARQITDAIAEQPAGMLTNLANTLSGQTADRGGGILSSLLGGGVLNTLVSTLSRFVGIGEGSTRTLMGLLTPVILGVLGREQRAQGLEASGLARMLMGQKDQILAAMPGDLSDLLTSRTRLHEGVDTSRPETRTYDAPQATYTRPAAPGMHRVTSEPRKARTATTWPYWVLPLVALGGLLWYLLQNTQGPDATATLPGESSPVAPGQVTPTGTPGKFSYLTKAMPGWMSISVYDNQEVHNQAGEKIGTIKDVLVGADGRVHAAVLSVGQFLGIGEKNIGVPLSALKVERRPDGTRLTVDVVKETLQTAPAFEYKR